MPKIQTVLMTKVEAETVLAEIKDGALSVRDLLAEFHEREGWRVLGYRTIAGCLKERLGISYTHAYRMIDSDQVKHNVQLVTEADTHDDTPEPNDAQARELGKLPAEAQQSAWATVVERATVEPGKKPKITAAAVREVVAEVLVEAPLPKGCVDDGYELHVDVAAALQDATLFDEVIRDLQACKRDVVAIGARKSAQFMHVQQITTDIANAIISLKFSRPKGPCLYCGQAGCKSGRGCKGCGWLPEGMYEAAKAAASEAE